MIKKTTKHRTITESHNGSNNQHRINNNRTTALEWTAAKATRGQMQLTGTKPPPQMLLLLKQKMLSSHGGFPTIATRQKKNNQKQRTTTKQRPPPPLKSHKAIGFLSNNGPDQLGKNTNLPSQHLMLGNYRPASETPSNLNGVSLPGR